VRVVSPWQGAVQCTAVSNLLTITRQRTMEASVALAAQVVGEEISARFRADCVSRWHALTPRVTQALGRLQEPGAQPSLPDLVLRGWPEPSHGFQLTDGNEAVLLPEVARFDPNSYFTPVELQHFVAWTQQRIELQDLHSEWQGAGGGVAEVLQRWRQRGIAVTLVARPLTFMHGLRLCFHIKVTHAAAACEWAHSVEGQLEARACRFAQLAIADVFGQVLGNVHSLVKGRLEQLVARGAIPLAGTVLPELLLGRVMLGMQIVRQPLEGDVSQAHPQWHLPAGPAKCVALLFWGTPRLPSLAFTTLQALGCWRDDQWDHRGAPFRVELLAALAGTYARDVTPRYKLTVDSQHQVWLECFATVTLK
jgi:hypothetical protein